MAKRKIDPDTHDSTAAEESASNDNNQLRAAFDSISKKLEAAKKEQQVTKDKDAVVFTPGIDRPERRKRLMDNFGMSFVEATEYLEEKPYTNRMTGEVSNRPGSNQASRERLGKNIRDWTKDLKELGEQLGIKFTDQVEQSRSNGHSEGQTPF